jgi:tetratricopeptide (TPR) repeat protein
MLDNSELEEPMVERWLAWLVDFAEKWGKDLEFHMDKVGIIGIEYPNLRNAIYWCQEKRDWKNLLLLANSTWFFPDISGLFVENQTILEASIFAAKTLGDKMNLARFERRLARLYWLRGVHYDEALTYLKQAEILANGQRNEYELVQIQYIRSNILARKNRQIEAEQIMLSALEMSKNLNNLHLVVLCLDQLAQIAIRQKDFEKGLKWLEQDEKLCITIGWSRGLSWSYYLQGVAFFKQGKLQEAEQFFSKSLQYAGNERRLIAHNKRRIAQIYSSTARKMLALHLAKEAQKLFEQCGMVEEFTEMNVLLRQLQTDDSLLQELLTSENT